MYQRLIDRRHPVAVAIMIQQSASMQESDTGGGRAYRAASAVDRIITELVSASKRGDELRDYFHVAVLGYTDTVRDAIAPSITDPRWRHLAELVDLSHIATRMRKVPDGSGGVLDLNEEYRCWIKPHSEGQVDLAAAFEAVAALVLRWITENESSFPPIIINISDGAGQDLEARATCEKVTACRTEDGYALVFNCYVHPSAAAPPHFPTGLSPDLDPSATYLYGLSSVLPQRIRDIGNFLGLPLQEGARALVGTSNCEVITRFLPLAALIPDLRCLTGMEGHL